MKGRGFNHPKSKPGFHFLPLRNKMPREMSDSSNSSSPVHVTRSPSPVNRKPSSNNQNGNKVSPFSIASILASSKSHHHLHHQLHHHQHHQHMSSGLKSGKDYDSTDPLMPQDTNILARSDSLFSNSLLPKCVKGELNYLILLRT